ncbi:Serine/threonine protein kinase PknB [Labilithrix luteola]|uniref:Serine/threonine protein kinase PknB n=1 Tax=Labilithrix luteola TaxID=1391654 RepID=A0A0K1PMJ5_9BACT|nr:hypothetical protein [Labilithrix luteola]AKU94743.1 Serine/threonine protein kinase PknB [Labilithrix luteola]
MKNQNTKPGVGPMRARVEADPARNDTEPSASAPANVDDVLDGLAGATPPAPVREQAESEGADGARYAGVASPAKSVLPAEQAEGAVIIAMTEPLPTLPTPVQALEPGPVVLTREPRMGHMIEETVPAAHRRRAVRRKVLSLIAMATVLATTFAVVLLASRERPQGEQSAKPSVASTSVAVSTASVTPEPSAAVTADPIETAAPPPVASSAARPVVAPVVPVVVPVKAVTAQPSPAQPPPTVKAPEPKPASPVPTQPASHEPPPKTDALRNL